MLVFFFGNLFDYPFFTGIWGTVADWVMILVTALTAYFLWRTLKSQRLANEIQNKTFKEQQIITKIELSEYTEKIKPFFKLEHHIFSENRTADFFYKVVLDFDFINLNGVAKNLQIKFNKELLTLMIDNINKDILYKNEIHSLQFASYQAQIMTPPNIDTETMEESSLYNFLFFMEFELTFEDILANKYSQIIELRHRGGVNKAITINSKPVKWMTID